MHCQIKPLIINHQSNFRKMNDLFKKAIQAGLGFAVVTSEKVKDIVDDLVEKGKYYQEKFEKEEEESDENAEAATSETVEDSDSSEHKQNRFEEIEQRVRKLIENAIARFNFIKSDEHERIEKRIEALEEKLNQLVKETVEQKSESSERV